MEKRKIIFYTILIILIVSMFSFLQANYGMHILAKKYQNIDLWKTFNLQKLPSSLNNPSKLIALSLLGLAVLFFFMLSFSAFCIGIYRLSKKKELLSSRQHIFFSLNKENALKLTLDILTILMLSYFLSIFILPLVLKSTTLGKNILAFSLISNLFFEFFSAFAVLAYIKMGQLNFSFYKIWPQIKKAVFLYLFIWPLFFAAVELTSFLAKQLHLPLIPQPVFFILLKEHNLFTLSLLIIEIVVFAPVAEELIFRGFLYKFLRQRFSFVLSAFLVSFLFALMHFNFKSFIPIAVLGFGFCYIYEKTQNILAPIIMHLIHNSLTAVIILVLKWAAG